MRLYCKPILLFITLFFTITSLYAQSADDAPFMLVTDYSTLEDGDEILLVNEKYGLAMGKKAGSNENRTFASCSVVIVNGQIETISDEVQVVVLEGEKDAWYLKVENGYLKIEPCIPKDWKEYQIQYKWKESIYNINIKNPEGKNIFQEETSKMFLDGNATKNYIKLDGEGNIYNIEVIL